MSGKGSRFLAAVAVAALLLGPAIADARLGSGSSMGSRGGMTFSAPPSTNTAPGGASPLSRSMTPSTPTPGYGTPGYGAPRSPFMSGLMGGLIGAGLGGLLFGGGFFGHGLGFGGFLGFLLQIFLISLLVRFLWRRFMGAGSPALAGGPGMFARGGMPNWMSRGMPTGMMGGSAAAPPAGGPPPVAIAPADFQEFEQILKAAQAAWSAQDLNALRSMSTPEMVGYFSEQLSDYASRGQTNTVSDVQLESGDLAQAWAEGSREYATVAMRFSMLDVTRDGAGRVVDGSQSERVTATELWTFVRARGGHWILSAIQQSR